jgi:hypothetical protein
LHPRGKEEARSGKLDLASSVGRTMNPPALWYVIVYILGVVFIIGMMIWVFRHPE